MTDPREYVTISDAASKLGIDADALTRACDRGELHAVRTAPLVAEWCGPYLVRVATVQAWYGGAPPPSPTEIQLDTERPYLLASEVGDLLGVSRETVRTQFDSILQPEIVPSGQRSYRRYSRERVLAFLASRQAA